MDRGKLFFLQFECVDTPPITLARKHKNASKASLWRFYKNEYLTTFVREIQDQRLIKAYLNQAKSKDCLAVYLLR